MSMCLQDNEIDNLMRLGGMAPSGGNIQPWKVRIYSDCFEIHLHPQRSGNFLDVGRCASIFSVGSFIENVSLASTSLGLGHKVEVREFQGYDVPIAKITYLERQEPDADECLVGQISRRHTNRHLHYGEPLTEACLNDLREAIQPLSTVRLNAVSSTSAKERAARIIGGGDAVRMQHARSFKEAMGEVRWTEEEAVRARDGIALSTLELPRGAEVMLRALKSVPALRKLLPQAALEKMSEAAVMGSSHLCLLSIPRPHSAEHLVLGGRALQRVWLKASSFELSIQPVTVLPFLVMRARCFEGDGFDKPEVDKLKLLGDELSELFSLPDDEMPLFIFRLSRPAAPASDRALRLRHEDFHERVR